MIKTNEISNPFAITKATDFTNQEIEEYWVDFFTSTGEDIVHYLNPTDITPKYIIGSKGCGKTHLLRYFSFPLQKLRRQNQVNEIIQIDKYIGLNIDLGGMNSSRMLGCGIAEDQWDAVFGYYLELFSGLYLLDTLIDMFAGLDIKTDVETELVNKIKESISVDHETQFESSLRGLRFFFNQLKKEVDYQINNAALIRKIDNTTLKIKISPGDIFFRIPQLLTTSINEFKELRIIFILDELEKLVLYQKKYINTLVWDKKLPTTFWIGARTYGFTTRETKFGETLRNGSEYQEVILDDIMREDEPRYRTFAINLCAKRLSGLISLDADNDPDKLGKEIDEYFDEFNEKLFF